MSTTDLEPVSGEIEQTAPLLPSGLVDVERARAAMTNYQELCAAVLGADDWIGEPGADGSFVKKSGWLALAKFYGLGLELVGETKLERDDVGDLIRASARVRATDPRDGRISEAGGACARKEPRFASARGRQNIEHDLPASAETRAMNRAISNLIGFGAVSAEEVDADVRAGAPESPVLPDWAAEIPGPAIDRFGDNLAAILTAAGVLSAPNAALAIGNSLATYCDGVVPAACARLARLLVQVTTPQTAPPVPDLEAEPEAAAAPDIPPEGGDPQ